MTTNFASHFVTKSRDDGKTFFYILNVDCPGWLLTAVREAHQGTLPNDWICEECRDAVAAFDAGDLYDVDSDDDVHDYVDGRVEIYTKDLYQWAADFCLTDTWGHAEQEATDMSLPEETEKRIQCIQYAAIRHIADTMKQACMKAAAETQPEPASP